MRVNIIMIYKKQKIRFHYCSVILWVLLFVVIGCDAPESDTNMKERDGNEKSDTIQIKLQPGMFKSDAITMMQAAGYCDAPVQYYPSSSGGSICVYPNLKKPNCRLIVQWEVSSDNKELVIKHFTQIKSSKESIPISEIIELLEGR